MLDSLYIFFINDSFQCFYEGNYKILYNYSSNVSIITKNLMY
nr:MAG TPA: hypothetical protein [Caudoviricetes sp.]